MPKTNYRLVVLTKTVAQVFEGNTCVAEFDVNGAVSEEDIEFIRTDKYEG